ncbi:MAG: DUF2520 domain-containing protein [Lachnospiraceae bacterium]|nr:DUF2520 domain-containing protein [Lachnospiraceae bacterium]
MKIGFIGAGNVGCSLGRYFRFHQLEVAGYYSRTAESAKEAAQLTKTAQFDTIEELVKTCDTLFLTVPDGQIGPVWNQIKAFPIEGKSICHCSGSLSTEIFSDIHETGAYGYSIHPMFPFNSKTISYESLQEALITVEGCEEGRDEMVRLFESFGNTVKVIEANAKTAYHAAAVMVSNQVVALFEMATDLLSDCGFSEEEALMAFKPLALKNLNNILAVGTTKALTGPVERNDVQTIEKHLQVFDDEQKDVYKACSKMLMHITKRKYPERNENMMKELLEEK